MVTFIARLQAVIVPIIKPVLRYVNLTDYTNIYCETFCFLLPRNFHDFFIVLIFCFVH